MAGAVLVLVVGLWLVVQSTAGELGPRLLSYRDGLGLSAGAADTPTAPKNFAGVPLEPTSSTGSAGIVEWRGAKVAAHVMPRFQAMVLAAERDGVKLGWVSTWRSSEQQIALRKAHCGAGWATAPASSCRPPTAKPGQSRHERGEAIDFNFGSNRSSPGFRWLAAHAAEYGFHNLPSEAWHWSTDGK